MKQTLYVDIPQYKIFDFHRHPSEMGEFDKNLSDFNIGKFCLMPTTIEHDFEDITAYFTKVEPYYKKYKDRAIIFGALDFRKDDAYNHSLLAEQKRKLNIQGIKLHPEQGFELTKKSLKPYFDAIADVLGVDIPIYIHTDWPLTEENGYAPKPIKTTFSKIVSNFKDFKYVMGHAGGSGAFLNVWKCCKKFANVYIETSMAPVTSPLEEVIWKIGAERLFFGSNYPYCATSIELVKLQSLYKVSDTDIQMILESNAEVLFEQ